MEYQNNKNILDGTTEVQNLKQQCWDQALYTYFLKGKVAVTGDAIGSAASQRNQTKRKIISTKYDPSNVPLIIQKILML